MIIKPALQDVFITAVIPYFQGFNANIACPKSLTFICNIYSYVWMNKMSREREKMRDITNRENPVAEKINIASVTELVFTVYERENDRCGSVNKSRSLSSWLYRERLYRMYTQTRVLHRI